MSNFDQIKMLTSLTQGWFYFVGLFSRKVVFCFALLSLYASSAITSYVCLRAWLDLANRILLHFKWDQLCL